MGSPVNINMVRGDGAGNIATNDSETQRTAFSRKKFDKKCSGFGSKSEAGSIKSNFSRAYNRGEIPCRINHGGVNHSIQWEVDPNDLESFDPLLVLFFEGLVETAHPFVFLVRSGLPQLLLLEDAAEKTVPILGKIVPHLRASLRSKDDEIFATSLAATCQLSNLVGEYLDPHVDSLIVQIGKHAQNRKHANLVQETLMTIESNGGPSTLAKIKKKVPTYCSVNM